LEQVRELSFELRPSILDDLGLASAVRSHANQQAQRGGFRVFFQAELPEGRLDPVLETTCFRVYQEALTNIIRHAQARTVRLEIRGEGERLVLKVQDDGVGFDPAAVKERARAGLGLGLLGMEERVAFMEGEIEFHSAPGKGTMMVARLPLVLAPPRRESDTERWSR